MGQLVRTWDKIDARAEPINPLYNFDTHVRERKGTFAENSVTGLEILLHSIIPARMGTGISPCGKSACCCIRHCCSSLAHLLFASFRSREKKVCDFCIKQFTPLSLRWSSLGADLGSLVSMHGKPVVFSCA